MCVYQRFLGFFFLPFQRQQSAATVNEGGEWSEFEQFIKCSVEPNQCSQRGLQRLRASKSFITYYLSGE